MNRRCVLRVPIFSFVCAKKRPQICSLFSLKPLLFLLPLQLSVSFQASISPPPTLPSSDSISSFQQYPLPNFPFHSHSALPFPFSLHSLHPLAPQPSSPSISSAPTFLAPIGFSSPASGGSFLGIRRSLLLISLSGSFFFCLLAL